MYRRVGRPGILGTAARTAVIAGTATAVSQGVGRRMGGGGSPPPPPSPTPDMQQMDAQMAAMQAQEAQMAAAAAASSDITSKLQQVMDMKQAGLLTDDEFAAAKARLLA